MDWIDDFVNSLPKTKEKRKNYIEIAGYPSWENVNSNLLAFYFDKNEEHGFEALFFDSLLDLIKSKYYSLYKEEWEKIDLLVTDFLVEREVPTDDSKRIDILLYEDIDSLDSAGLDDEVNFKEITPSWAIIIENKINAPLNNDLVEYWNSVKAEYKIGVILSKNEIRGDSIPDNNEIIYINILHRELIDRVIYNMSGSFMNSDDRHLLLLKEFILNINSLYMDPSYQQQMDAVLKQFRTKAMEIRTLKANDKGLLKYISDSVFSVMNENGFPPASDKNTSRTKFFFFDDDSNLNVEYKDIAKKFRFWFDIGSMRYSSEVRIFFELFNKSNTIYGDILKSRLKEEGMFTDGALEGGSGKVGGSFYHIYQLKLDLSNQTQGTFEKNFKSEIETKFFRSEKGHFVKTVKLLHEIINNKED